jgi:hypothetical protein
MIPDLIRNYDFFQLLERNRNFGRKLSLFGLSNLYIYLYKYMYECMYINAYIYLCIHECASTT